MRTKRDARRLFLRETFGVLSTISLDVPGYPFGSITPYCADAKGQPVVYISTIAQHTRNILADSKVSLTIVERPRGDDSGEAPDVQAAGRITCVADARRLNGDATGNAAARYLRYFPAARQYDGTHDFAFFALELVRVRYIGGFGQIYWVEPGEFALLNPFAGALESRILDHMNQDHRESLRRYAGADAEMVGIDAEGFDLRTERGRQRIEFQAPIATMEEARQALIALATKPA